MLALARQGPTVLGSRPQTSIPSDLRDPGKGFQMFHAYRISSGIGKKRLIQYEVI